MKVWIRLLLSLALCFAYPAFGADNTSETSSFRTGVQEHQTFPTLAQFDLFGPYMRGQQAAQERNWQDAQNYQQAQYEQRMNQIYAYINKFNQTNDARYLYVAAELGSDDASQWLSENNFKCGRTQFNEVVCKQLAR